MAKLQQSDGPGIRGPLSAGGCPTKLLPRLSQNTGEALHCIGLLLSSSHRIEFPPSRCNNTQNRVKCGYNGSLLANKGPQDEPAAPAQGPYDPKLHPHFAAKGYRNVRSLFEQGGGRGARTILTWDRHLVGGGAQNSQVVLAVTGLSSCSCVDVDVKGCPVG